MSTALDITEASELILARGRLVTPMNQDDAIAGHIPIEVEKCPLCIESMFPTLVEEILAAPQTVGPALTAEEFFQWLKTEFPATGD